MAKKASSKESPQRFLNDFIQILERHTEELEKFAEPFLEQQKEVEETFKPLVESQQNLLRKSISLQREWMENVAETTNKLANRISDEQLKGTEEYEKLLSEIGSPSEQLARYVQNIQRVQKAWLEQLKNTMDMMEGFFKNK